MVQIEQLFIYPIKSCAAVAVDFITFDDNGPVGDRRYMLVDGQGRFLTQRTLPRMAHIYPEMTDDGLLVRAEGAEPLSVEPADAGGIMNVQVWKDDVRALDCGNQAAQWFESVLGKACRLVKLLPDSDRQVSRKYAADGEWVSFADGFPLLVTTTESLAVLSDSVGRALDMRRFRPNIVLSGGAAFDELQWQTLMCPAGEIVLCKPCERCVIPTRDITTQQRETDVLEALKRHCRIDGKLIFGQNGLVRGVKQLITGDTLQPLSE